MTPTLLGAALPEIRYLEKENTQLQAGDSSAAPSGTSDRGTPCGPESSGFIRLPVMVTDGFSVLPQQTRGWYYRKEEDVREYIFAFANAKGSSSIRPFDACNGAVVANDKRDVPLPTIFEQRGGR